MSQLLIPPGIDYRQILLNPPQRQPEMRTYNPGLRERIGNWIYDAAMWAGLPNANRMRDEAQMAVDFVPVAGDAVGAQEAGQAYAGGDYLGAVLGAGSLIPIVGDVAAKGVKKGIKAYHGSPHDFDRFSMDKIGTGEGAQSYGHGLYFAENEGVARSYKDALSGRASNTQTAQGAAERFLGMYSSREEAMAALDREIATIRKQAEALRQRGVDTSAFLARIDNEYAPAKEMIASGYSPGGRMYEVNINANPEDFLDWDKPLSEQPTALKAVERLFESGALDGKDKKASQAWADPSFREHLKTMTGERARDMIAAYRTGGQVYSGYFPTVKGGSKAQADAANLLRSENIPGVKYLDAGSRGAGDGSRNYVVFDDKLISIVRKYGLAGAVAAGVITQQQAEQMQQQGLI